MSARYALIIGNSEYEDSRLAQLTAPGKDAEDFAGVLRDKDLCAFDDVKVVVNQEEPVVRVAIDEFFDAKAPDDLLLLYFSGHGVRDELGALYLAVKNTNRARLRSTAVKSEFIHEAMEQSRAKRQVLILDCCNSGAFPQGVKAATGVSIGTATVFGGGYGRIILTASDSLQYAWQGDAVIGGISNSLFTHYLVEGLKGEAELDENGCITVDALYDYAYEKVRLATPSQTPSKFSSKQEGEIVLRKITRMSDVKPAALPGALVARMEDISPGTRFGAVRDLANLLTGSNLALAKSAREALERIAGEDDSRSVQAEARQALEPIRQAEQLAQRKAEEERLAAEKAEAERQAEARRAEEEHQKEELARQEAARRAQDQADRAIKARAAQEAARRAAEAAPVAITGTTAQPAWPSLQPGVPAPAPKAAARPRRTALVVVGGLALLAAVAIFSVIAIGAYGAMQQANAAATRSAEGYATDSALIASEATAAAQSTSEAVRATNVAVIAATGTAAASATQQAARNVLSTAEAVETLVYTPYNDQLKLTTNGTSISEDSAGVDVKNFVAEATFVNPYSTSVGNWDYGFLFRNLNGNNQYRLFLTSDSEWRLTNNTGSVDGALIASGSLPDMDVSENGSNSIRLICQDDKGTLYVNGSFVADLDLSARQNTGDVSVGTAFYTSDQVTGYSVQFKRFTVWQLP